MRHLLILLSATILAAAALVGPARAGARQDATVLLSDQPQVRRIQEEWGFASAVVAGDTVYLSGVVVGLGPGETDLQAAYTRAYESAAKTLARAGLSLDDVVDVTSFHTDLTTQLPAMVAVQKRFLRSPPPAWTAIEVARLVPDRGITEIKLVARRPRQTG
jgi:enamine deaminase RidA (YjgF/YER057c/UK114 family)